MRARGRRSTLRDSSNMVQSRGETFASVARYDWGNFSLLTKTGTGAETPDSTEPPQPYKLQLMEPRGLTFGAGEVTLGISCQELFPTRGTGTTIKRDEITAASERLRSLIETKDQEEVSTSKVSPAGYRRCKLALTDTELEVEDVKAVCAVLQTIYQGPPLAVHLVVEAHPNVLNQIRENLANFRVPASNAGHRYQLHILTKDEAAQREWTRLPWIANEGFELVVPRGQNAVEVRGKDWIDAIVKALNVIAAPVDKNSVPQYTMWNTSSYKAADAAAAQTRVDVSAKNPILSKLASYEGREFIAIEVSTPLAGNVLKAALKVTEKYTGVPPCFALVGKDPTAFKALTVAASNNHGIICTDPEASEKEESAWRKAGSRPLVSHGS